MTNDFTRGMAMVRKHDPQVQEDGFGLVRGVVAVHVPELVDAYAAETDLGVRCWLLELLGEARSRDALPLFSEAMVSPDGAIRFWAETGLEKLGTKEARTLLWSHRHLQP